jgi:hypothetical protein
VGAVCLDGGLLVGMTAAPAMSAYANALLRVHVGVTTQRAPAQYRFKRSAFKVTALMVRVRALGEAAAGKYWTAGAHLPLRGTGHLRISNGDYEWVSAIFTASR